MGIHWKRIPYIHIKMMKMPSASAFRTESGFTLVELLIVVLILGILAAVVLPATVSSALEADEAVLMGNLNALRKAIDLYHFQHNDTYPNKNEATVVAQLTGKTDKDGDPGSDYGPYLRQIPVNPVNNMSKIKLKHLPGAPNDSSGWYYDEDTGEIRANSSGTGPSGIDYIDL